MHTLSVEILERATGEKIAAYTLECSPPAGGSTDYAIHHERGDGTVHESRVYWGKGPRRTGTMNTEVQPGETIRAWAFDIDAGGEIVSNVLEYTVE